MFDISVHKKNTSYLTISVLKWALYFSSFCGLQPRWRFSVFFRRRKKWCCHKEKKKKKALFLPLLPSFVLLLCMHLRIFMFARVVRDTHWESYGKKRKKQHSAKEQRHFFSIYMCRYSYIYIYIYIYLPFKIYSARDKWKKKSVLFNTIVIS